MRIKQFAKEKFGGLSQLAHAIDRHQSQLSKYTSDGTMPGGEILQKLAELGCNINWLLMGEGEMICSDEKGSGEPNYVPVEFADINHVPAGEKQPLTVGSIPSIEAQQFPSGVKIIGAIPAGVAEFTYFFEESIQYINPAFNPATHFAVLIDKENGFSMAPILLPGDIVIASTTDKPITGDIVAAAFVDEEGSPASALKIVHFPEGLNFVGLSSANPAITPLMVSPANIKNLYRISAIIKPKNRLTKTQ